LQYRVDGTVILFLWCRIDVTAVKQLQYCQHRRPTVNAV